MTTRGIICLQSLQNDILISINKVPDYVDYLLALVFLISSGIILYRRILSSKINQWLVIVQDGVQKKSGKGISTFVYPLSKFIKFNHEAWNIPFQAQLITKQWQGIYIKGDTLYQINPQKGGPYLYHKFLDKQIRDLTSKLTESALRYVISDLTLEQIMLDRQNIKYQVKVRLQQMKRWGVIINDIVISEIKVLSRQTDKKLQTEYIVDRQYQIKKMIKKNNEQKEKRQLRLEYQLKQEKIKKQHIKKKQVNKNNVQKLKKEIELLQKLLQVRKKNTQKGNELQIRRIKANQQIQNMKQNKLKQIDNKMIKQ